MIGWGWSVVAVPAAWAAVAVGLAVAVRGEHAGSARRRVHPETGGGVAHRGPVVLRARLGALGHGWSPRRDERRELLAVVDVLASSFAAGASPSQAIEAAAAVPGSVPAGLGPVSRQVRDGTGVQAALDGWAQLHARAGAVLLADALAIADATGGSRARALAGVRDTLREAEALALEVRALGSQARISAVVLVAVPVAFAALAAVADGRVAAFLLGTPAGWACVCGGLVLDGFGAWWMARLTDRFA